MTARGRRHQSRWVLSCLVACAAIPPLRNPASGEPGPPFSISAEGVYWRPGGLDFPVIQPANTPIGTNLGTGRSRGIEHLFSPGYGIVATWGRLRAKWLDIQAQRKFSAQCPGSSCFAARIGDFINGVSVDVAEASSFLRFQVLDLELLRSFGDAFGGTSASWSIRCRNIWVTGLEFGVKTTYRPIDRLEISLGVDLMQFLNALSMQTYPGTIGAGSAQEDRRSLSFVGPRFGMVWRFSGPGERYGRNAWSSW